MLTVGQWLKIYLKDSYGIGEVIEINKDFYRIKKHFKSEGQARAEKIKFSVLSSLTYFSNNANVQIEFILESEFEEKKATSHTLNHNNRFVKELKELLT